MFPSLDPRSVFAVLAALVLESAPLGGAAGEPHGASDVAAQVATKLAAELERSYVYEDKGVAMAAALRAKAATGAWKDLRGRELATALTDTCRSVVDDKHLSVRFQPPGGEQAQNSFLLDETAARREWTQRNFGFERAERMQGNVGYLELREFVPANLSRATAAAAMAFLQDTDALVLDLRRNGGGDPASVQFLCSYFFDSEPVHLNTLVNRELGEVDEFWTLRDLPGRRYLKKPVFVLVSGKTFSGAEEFAYDLQSQGRATIVGRTTGGGAHPCDLRQLGGDFSVVVPVARAENPITKTNWEGVGVVPNVDVADDVALEHAWALALEQMAEKETDAGRRKLLADLAAEKRTAARPKSER
jgi:hypothetical protein